jgi:uncharacterized protein
MQMMEESTMTDQHAPSTALPSEPIDEGLAAPKPCLDSAAIGVPEAERIASLDVLRGFALLGILVMNVQSFSMIDAAYGNPTAYGDLEGANYWVWALGHVFADQKFMTLFSMLFGAGIVLMTSRREQAGYRPAAAHYRRMAVLLLFGLLHAYLIWGGDILYSYALCGMVAYLFRRLSPRGLLFIALPCLVVPSAILLLVSLAWPDLDAKTRAEFLQNWQPDSERVAAELVTYRGSWLQVFHHRWPLVLVFQTKAFALFIVWRAGGLMLMGMALFKLGIFSGTRRLRAYVLLLILGWGLAIPVIVYGIRYNFAADWSVRYAKFQGSQFNYWASIPMSLGWVGLVMLVYSSSTLRPAMRPLATVGQTALTNYLMQSVICTTLFYGYGFGLFGRIERVGQIGIVAIIWVLQLVVSPVWLRYFRFGPVEWLWRALTYRRWPPMLRRTPLAWSSRPSLT